MKMKEKQVLKILGITPSNEHTGMTPEELYLTKLEDLGHEVTLLKKVGKDDNFKNYDVVVSLSEVSCELAFRIAQQYNLPYYAHMEWLPPWRIFLEDPYYWGMENTKYDYKTMMNFIRIYQQQSFYWAMATNKTLAADCFKSVMRDFIGADIPISTKYLGPNTDKIKQFLAENKDIVKKDEITCVARFVPHKRIHHIIEALKLINYKGILNLVGYGPEQDNYNKIKGDINISYFDSKDKFNCLSRSKVNIALWSGIVPAESMYVGVPCITYDSPYMRELYDDTIIYAKNNDIIDLARVIKEWLDKPESLLKAQSEYGVIKIECGQINTHTLEKTVELLEQQIKLAVDNKR